MECGGGGNDVSAHREGCSTVVVAIAAAAAAAAAASDTERARKAR